MPLSPSSSAEVLATPATARPWAVSNRGLAVALAGLGLAGLVFGLWPQLDLATAALFYVGEGHFAGQTRLGEILRKIFYWGPFALFVLMTVCFAARRLGGVAIPAPGLRAFAFLALSLALGPGLLVNLLLKDHWHRPRPVQVEAFGGTMPFRPYYRADGACRRNCSFVSGEGSTAVWCLAPALLAPPPLQTAAVLAAVAFSAGTCVLRMAFGGHFLSDVVFAALLTWLIIIAAWRSTQAGAGRR